MPRPPSEPLSQRESQIMDLLWDLGEATSEQIRARLPGQPHDSSVRTILRILISKGMVTADTDTRPALYRAAVAREAMQAKATKSLLQRFFKGSAEQLLLHLLEEEALTPEQLTELRRKFGKRKGDSK